MSPSTTESPAASADCVPRRRQKKQATSDARVAAVCKALGDENRLHMLQMILEAGELCACEIEAHFALSQPTVSHHLRLLRNAGLIEGERRGSWVHYRALAETLDAVALHPVFKR